MQNPDHRKNLKARSPHAMSVNAVICEKEGVVHYVKHGYVSGIIEFMGNSFIKQMYPSIHASEKIQGVYHSN